MNCPNCGAPMRLEKDKDYFNCDYCKNLYFPQASEEGVRVLGEPTPLNCPVCAVPLLHATAGGMRFLYCDRCRGMLIPMGIFVALIEELRAQLGAPSIIQGRADPADVKRQLACPQCHGPMDTHPYYGPGNIIIDSCSRCDVNWLDHGELLRVARAPDHPFKVEWLPPPPELDV